MVQVVSRVVGHLILGVSPTYYMIVACTSATNIYNASVADTLCLICFGG